MEITLYKNDRRYRANLAQPMDISLAIGTPGPRAWYVPDPAFEPVTMGDFTGSVEKGGSVNFFNVFFNPHGHGTHTECLGHITAEKESISEHLQQYFFIARLVTIYPHLAEGFEEEFVEKDDHIITGNMLELVCHGAREEALVIRTLPNEVEKKTRNYSSSNPPYLTASAGEWLQSSSFQHLLIDLPSVDREEDKGRLQVHRLFWELPNNPRYQKTITEMVYVDNSIKDGLYLLNLQVAAFQNDASPSRPLLFRLEELP